MRYRVALRARLAASAALVLGFADVMWAQGEGTKAPAPANPTDGIAEARKDFESLKSARDAALVPGNRMPRVSVPEMSLPGSSPSSIQPKTKPVLQDTKSANWLVDAMEKQTSSRTDRKGDPRFRDRKSRSGQREQNEAVTEREKGPAGENETGPTSSERAQISERDSAFNDDPSAVVVNPLNSFLGEWMTPQDYALLKPGLTHASEHAALPAFSPLPATGGTGVSGNGLKDWLLPNSTSPAVALPQPPRDNPYLQSMNAEVLAPQSPVGSKPIDIMPTAQSARSTAPMPAARMQPETPSAPKIPDFAKPLNDDRYFKQLKRF